MGGKHDEVGWPVPIAAAGRHAADARALGLTPWYDAPCTARSNSPSAAVRRREAW